MANMSYVRFEITLSDLQDAYDHLDDEELSQTEGDARNRLIALCEKIAEEYCGND